MVYTYTPAYYSSFQDSITSLCKSILPFSLKKRGLPAAERKLSKQQTDNLKWQQDSFHQILNLMGLHSEGILPESEVAAFKSQLLETLIASKGTQHEHPVILRDKLLFLQELLYAKCISDEEYHASKRPLLQRLSVQGAEIEAKDVILGSAQKENIEEEWSVIDLKDEQQCSINTATSSKNKLNKPGSSAIKQHIKGAATVLGFGGKNRGEKSIFDDLGSNGAPDRNPTSILMTESSVLETEKARKRGFMGKRQWGFDGFKKWNKGNSEDENEACGDYYDQNNNACFKNSNAGVGEGPDTRQIKKKLHSDGSASDFFIDKVLGHNIKKELTRIQAELNSTNANLQFSNDEMETISTKLPVDKADLQKFFPKSWCDRHGDVVLDVVKKEFKGHVESTRRTAPCQRRRTSTKFHEDEDEGENSHPNLFSHDRSNLLLHEEDEKRLRNQSFSNPFWNSTKLGSSSIMH